MTPHDASDPSGAAAEAQDAVQPAALGGGAERSGDLLGSYQLLQEIGEGGMGTVWRAQQSAPIQRQVALKIIKLGMDTKEVVARFEVERQALAIMDHAHIAKVFDAGATQFGRPYFVMELVSGEPITKACNRAQLSIRERLELFVKVCNAIQHAHQKGIIHRDIKPSNLLVTLEGGLEPKVIDFGIAKASGSGLMQETLLTHHTQSIGSPEYMAPEQAELSGVDVDTRADVYSLGVVLYELLTGARPFNMRQVLRQGHDEMLRTLREVDPPKPSDCVRSAAERLEVLARDRQLKPNELAALLAGDLDWIVMKALEKERARRYQSVSGLAEDVQRYLSDEAVLAAPQSAAYRLRKFIHRRRNTVIAAALSFALFVAGAIGTGIGLYNTTLANRGLDLALQDKEQQRLLAQGNETRAQNAERRAKQQAAELEQVVSFQEAQLMGLDLPMMGIQLRGELLEAAADSKRNNLRQALTGVNFTSLAMGSLRSNLFARTLASIDEQFAQQPLVKARLLHSLASTLGEVGLSELALEVRGQAIEIRRASLGDGHLATLDSILAQGVLCIPLGRLQEAESFIEEALLGFRALFGDEHPKTLEALSASGSLLAAMGRPAEAEKHFQAALEGLRRTQGPEHRDTLSQLGNLASVLHSQKQFRLAEAHQLEAIQGSRHALGNFDRDTLFQINNMGAMLYGQGRFNEAESFWQEALRGKRQVLGDEHPATLLSLVNMGVLCQAQGRPAEAMDCYAEALEKRRRNLGDEHADTLTLLNNMGVLQFNSGSLVQAEAYLREASQGRERLLGKRHPDTQVAAKTWGQAAEKLVAALRKTASKLDLGLALEQLGNQKQLSSRYGEAELSLGEARQLLLDELGSEHWRVWQAQGCWALAIAAQGRFLEAEPKLLESAESMSVGSHGLGLPGAAEASLRMLQAVIDFYRSWEERDPGRGHAHEAAQWSLRRKALTD